MSTMDVMRSPRGKGGRFTKKGEDSTLVSPSNPLLSFATVALATVRKHQRLMDMASTVPHIDDIAEAKAMIRSGLYGRALMAGSWLCVEVYLLDVYSGLLVACASHGAVRPAVFL